MTFCFFSAQYPPTVGGVERYTLNLARALVQKGHAAVVVTSAVPGCAARETDEAGVRVVRVPSLRLLRGRFPVLTPAGARAARRALREVPADFAVVQTRLYPLCAFGARWAKKNGVPAIVVEHGTAHLFRGGVPGLLGSAYEHALMRRVRRACDDFYGVSEACCAWLAHFGVHTQKVLYNAVDVAAVQRTAAACGDAFLAPCLPAGAGPVIAFVGRFIPEKGILQLLEAFRRVRQVHPDAVLLCAGDGPLYAEARRAAAKTPGAVLLGMLPYEQCLALLRRADYFCLPTFSEGFCTSVLEAAALDCAVLTTATGGSPELILDGDHGLLLRGMDADAVADGLLQALAAGEAWRARACANAYRVLCSRFTWDAVSETLLAAAREKCAAPAKPIPAESPVSVFPSIHPGEKP